MELSMWLASTLFFAFVLSHLISDMLFHHREAVYHFTFFLMSIGLTGIIYCERHASGMQISAKKTIFEIQGRFLSFEIFFILTLLFVMNH